MPAFEYAALDAGGKNRKGLIEADTPRLARSQLRDKGLTPLDVQLVAERAAQTGAAGLLAGVRGNSGTGMSVAEQTLFTRQLATLSRSGLPIDEALAAVAEQSESARVRRVTLGIRAQVQEGNTLAAAMGHFPRAFPPLFRATVEAGEQAGKLDQVLERLADYVERRAQLRGSLLLAAIYPLILTVVAIGVVVALLTYVVPQVVGVFASIDMELPLLTRGMIAVADFLKAWLVWMLIGLAVGVGLFTRAMKQPAFARKVHVLLLRLPLVGKLLRGAEAGRFLRTLGILTSSGVSILEGLRISTQVLALMPFREAIEIASKQVREGVPIARALAATKTLPPIAVHLIASGEQSGKLDHMLERAADTQERETEITVQALMKLFEPVLIVVMGGVVMTIVMAILLPIFNMNNLVK